MAIARGTRFGSYEVAALIGVGGMGEVYRAHDTSLKRDVALKVLPEELLTDANRLARFQHEAEVLASLSHGNVAHIYGLERSDGRTALVMELVEGSTLAERIGQGPLPPSEALDVATADRRRARSRARARHRASRSEAAQHQAQARRYGQGPRLRHRQGARPARDERAAPQALTTPAMTRGRHRARHGRVHVARAGARRSRRPARRHLGIRLRALRDVDRQARVPRRGHDDDARARARAGARHEAAAGRLAPAVRRHARALLAEGRQETA